MTPEERFWLKVDRKADQECWEWQAYVCHSTGYGRFAHKSGSVIGAHRYSFELHHRPLVDGELVMHSCDNRRCVNPKHLSAGTNRLKLDDMMAKGRSSRGEKCGTAILTVAQVVEIRERYAVGEPGTRLSREFNVSRSQVTGIVRGTFWPHAGGPITYRRKKPSCNPQ